MQFEPVKGFGILLLYFVVCAAAALALRRFISMPREVFRKLLHTILLGSILVLTHAFQTWWYAAFASILFMLMVFPILAAAESIPGYSQLLVERSNGEIKRSLVVVFSMFAVLITLCWGLLGEKYLVRASVFAWGFGDTAAALVGKRYGKNFIEGRLVEGRKSLEGTLAMFVVAFFTILAVLIANSAVVWYGYLPTAAVTAAACAAVELYTKNGMDTLTCPLTAAAVLILLIRLWGV